jgi:hypothetical protein
MPAPRAPGARKEERMAGLSTWRRGIVQAVAAAVVAAAFASVPLTLAAADRDDWRPRFNSWHGDDDDDQGEGYRRGGWSGGSVYFYGGPGYYYAPMLRRPCTTRRRRPSTTRRRPTTGRHRSGSG